MGKSVIKVSCVDQVLKLKEAPALAAGGLNEVRVEFSFCQNWNGFVKTATFYRDEEEAYYAVLDENDTCILPWEVCFEAGTFYIGVFGVKDDARRTSNVVRYRVKKGAVTEDMKPSEPSPEVYDQIMAEVANMRETASHNIKSIEKTGTDGLVDTYTITFIDESTQTYTVTNGDKGDQGSSIHPCEYDGSINDTGSISYYTFDIYQYFPNGGVKTGELFVTKAGYICRITDVAYLNTVPPTVTVYYSMVANLNGNDGAKGDNGNDGADGKSAYQYAQDGGYTGTEEEFAERLASCGVPSYEVVEGEGNTALEEYNLITLATEVSTAEEFLAFDGIALLKDYEYNGVSTKINTDDKYWVLKVPVQSGDVIRSNTITYYKPTSTAVAYQYIGFYDANDTLITITTAFPQQPVRLIFDGNTVNEPTYLYIREHGATAPEGAVYALVNVLRDYYVNNTTLYQNGREASIVTLNKDASLTAYDGTYQLENYVPVADRDIEKPAGSTETYYKAVDDIRIPRYEDKLEMVNGSVSAINASLSDIETILANVVGGVV